jgi:DNA-binding SARP family transcriptional activator/tetratricopeptide (TPR) repeat protein
MSEQEEDMRFEILGPMRVIVRDRELAVRAGRDRTLLAMLILHANHTVPMGGLVDALWAESPPKDGRGQLQGCVSRLRKQFAGVGVSCPVINTEPEGYRLLAGGATVDLLEFRRLIDEARVAANAGRRYEARAQYRSALALWRGPALASIDRGTIQEAAAGLNEERARAVEECIDLELVLGGAGELVSELTDLIRQDPYREPLHAALMLALYRADRQADALAAYQRVRRTLVAELGQEPGVALRKLHQRILAGDPELRPSLPTASTKSDSAQPATSHLPRTVADFTGRDADVSWLLETADQADPYAPLVVTIDGMPGVGKTSLAVRVGHLLRSRFPDGQLFIDLHGHSEHRPVDPAAALSSLLRQIGVSAPQIAADLDDRIAQWRAELATRRVLVVLDNAATGTQVNALLPSNPGCMVLVTSRRRLVDLDSARPRSLETLKASAAVALLERIVGARVREDQDAAAEVAKRCGYLPLALRLAGARLVHRPGWKMRDLADRLTGHDSRLSALSVGDRTIADTFGLSYTHLSSDHQRMFRLLGLHPGDHFDVYAAAALADVNLDDAARLLDGLINVHLVDEPHTNRYRLHDLVRLYASQLAVSSDSDHERKAAIERLLDYYLHATATATAHLKTRRNRRTLRSSHPMRSDLINERHTRMEWLEMERPNLVAAVHCAAAYGNHRYTSQLACAIWRFLYLRGYVDDIFSTHQLGLVAAEHIDDIDTTATMHSYLASAYYLNGFYNEAAGHVQQALAHYVRAKDGIGEAVAQRNLAAIYAYDRRKRRAVEECERALTVATRADDLTAVANTVASASGISILIGDHWDALAFGRRALALARRLGDERCFALALGNLGAAHARLGQHRPALRLLRIALRLRRHTHNRWDEAETLNELGGIYRTFGRFDEAVAHHRLALTIVRESGFRQEECAVCNEFGRTLREAGDVTGALELHQRALTVATKIRHRYNIARALDGIAACLRETDPASACQHWLQALELYRELEVPERHEVERQLAALPAHATGG